MSGRISEHRSSGVPAVAEAGLGQSNIEPRRYLRQGIVLQRGNRSSIVKELQRDLKAIGYYHDGRLDGIYGPNTAEAVRNLQRDFRIAVDGIVGPQTKAVIRHAYVQETGVTLKPVESSAGAGTDPGSSSGGGGVPAPRRPQESGVLVSIRRVLGRLDTTDWIAAGMMGLGVFVWTTSR